MLPFNKLYISLWCRGFLSIFDIDSDSRPHFRSEWVQRFIYFKQLGTLFIGEEIVRSNGNYCYHPLKWMYLYDADVFFRFSIFDIDSDFRPHFLSESVQRLIYFKKVGIFVHRRRVCKEWWELVTPSTKLDISLWCRCYLSIFEFDSDSRPHYRAESVHWFIYFNKIEYFVHRSRVCNEQWELILPFNKLDKSLWCGCYLSIFEFDSDSRPHFRAESVQRFKYFHKVGYFVQNRIVCKCQLELVSLFTKLDIALWCRCILWIFDFDSEFRPHCRFESVHWFIYFNKIGYFVHRRRACNVQWEFVLPFTKLDISLWYRCFLSIFDIDSDSRPHFRSEWVQRFIYFKKMGTLFIGEEIVRSNGNYCFHPLKWIYLYDADVFFRFSIFDIDSDSRPHFRSGSVQRLIYFKKVGIFVHRRRVCKE